MLITSVVAAITDVSNRLQFSYLFKTDNDLIDRFIIPAPFSKFYLEIDNESPGKIGQWIGWQILRSFRKKNPSFKIADILNLSSEELFKKANYKP